MPGLSLENHFKIHTVQIKHCIALISDETCRWKTGIAKAFLLMRRLKHATVQSFRWGGSTGTYQGNKVEHARLRDTSSGLYLILVPPLLNSGEKSRFCFPFQELFLLTDLESKVQRKWFLLLCETITLARFEIPLPSSLFPWSKQMQKTYPNSSAASFTEIGWGASLYLPEMLGWRRIV